MTHPHIHHIRTALANRQQYHAELQALAKQLEAERELEAQQAMERGKNETTQRENQQ